MNPGISVLVALAMVFTGCTSAPRNTARELPRGAYFRQTVLLAKTMSETPDVYSAGTLAYANREFGSLSSGRFGRDAKCFLIPTPTGLIIEILTSREITASEQIAVIEDARTALADGAKIWETFRQLKTEPSSQEPTSGLRPAAVHL